MISHSVADKENSESLSSLWKIRMDIIIADIWGEKVKRVKRGPRNDREVAYLNIKGLEKGSLHRLVSLWEKLHFPKLVQGHVSPKDSIFFLKVKEWTLTISV